MVKTIQVSNEFHSKVQSHGKWGERMEDILMRLLPKEFIEAMTGDKKDKNVYSKNDVDTKATKKKRGEL